MYKVLIPEDIAESGKNYLRERGYELKVGCATDEETLAKELMDADAVIVRNAKYRKPVFANSPRLKVIARHGTGTDNIDVKDAEALGIWVVNGPLANINAVAEYTIGFLLALGKGLVWADQATRANDWSWRLTSKNYELEGKTLGVIGYGNIGKIVARKAALGFGMKVFAYDINHGTSDTEGVVVSDDLDMIIRSSDFLTLHIPSTPKTRHMCDRDMFAKMKAGSCFINCARGDLYDEDALVEALSCGHLRGAALDVYATEPLPPSSKLLTLKNVVLSQHNAGLSEESKAKMSLYAAMGVDQVLTGQKPTWPVNHPTREK